MATDTVGFRSADSIVQRPTLRRAWSGRWARARWPLPAAVAVGAISCVLLAIQGPALIAALYRNADNAATLLLAQDHPAGSVIRMGDHPFYEAWWFMRMTAGLPGHILIWQLAPFAVAFLGIGAIAACAGAVAGRSGFVVAAAGGAAMSPPLRAILLVPEARVGLVLHAAVLCGALLLVDRLMREGRMTTARWIAAVAALAGFTAAGATDQLLIPAGVAPLVLAALAAWWCERTTESRTLAMFALATAAGSVALAAFITRTMTAAGVQIHQVDVHLVGLASVGSSIGVTLHLFAILAGGSWNTAAGLLALVALAAMLGALARGTRRSRRQAFDARQRTRLLYVSFWGTALLLTLGVVVLTSAGLGNGVYDAAQRYLLGAWAALLALLAAGARSRVRANALLAGICVFGVLNLALNVSSLHQPWQYGPNARTERAIQRFVLAHRATVGYGSYWDVMPIGLDAIGRVRAVPIVELGSTGRWVGHYVAANGIWFSAHPGVRASFLVTDARRNVPFAPRVPPAVFGRPVAAGRFGPLTVYVYGHDLVSDLVGAVS